MSKDTEFKKGDRVKVRPGKNHNAMTKDAKGTVVEISTPALGIEFDNMPGEIHKWHVDDELARLVESNPQRKKDDKPEEKKKPHKMP